MPADIVNRAAGLPPAGERRVRISNWLPRTAAAGPGPGRRCRATRRQPRTSIPRAAWSGSSRTRAARRWAARSSPCSAAGWAAAGWSPTRTAAGRFVVRALPAGSYTVRALRDGHQPARARKVTVMPDRDVVLTTTLTPLAEAAAAAVRAAAAPLEKTRRPARAGLAAASQDAVRAGVARRGRRPAPGLRHQRHRTRHARHLAAFAGRQRRAAGQPRDDGPRHRRAGPGGASRKLQRGTPERPRSAPAAGAWAG